MLSVCERLSTGTSIAGQTTIYTQETTDLEIRVVDTLQLVIRQRTVSKTSSIIHIETPAVWKISTGELLCNAINTDNVL